MALGLLPQAGKVTGDLDTGQCFQPLHQGKFIADGVTANGGKDGFGELIGRRGTEHHHGTGIAGLVYIIFRNCPTRGCMGVAKVTVFLPDPPDGIGALFIVTETCPELQLDLFQQLCGHGIAALGIQLFHQRCHQFRIAAHEVQQPFQIGRHQNVHRR